MSFVRLLVLSSLLLSFTSCTCSRQNGSDQDANQNAGANAQATPDPNKAPDYSGITVEQVITKDLEAGKGAEIKAGSNVSGFYGMWVYAPAMLGNKGKFIAGTPENRKESFAFEVGKEQVVKGWDQGVIGMRAGGKRSIIVPISLGYGEKGTDDVPPNSILLVEFEAISVK